MTPLTPDIAIQAIRTRPAERWALHGYGKDWTEGEVAEVLGDEVERLREQVRWRKYPGEKPEDQQDCVVATEPLGEFGVGNYRKEFEGWVDDWIIDQIDAGATVFWRPLTQPEGRADG